MQLQCVLIICALIPFSCQDKQAFDAVVRGFANLVSKSTEDCKVSTGVNRSIVEDALKTGNFVEDKNFMCFLNCLDRNLSIVDEHDVMQDEGVLKVLVAVVEDEEARNIAMATCKDLKGNDACETSFKTIKCKYDKLRELLS